MPTVNQHAAAILALLETELPLLREAIGGPMMESGEWQPELVGSLQPGPTNYAASGGQVGRYRRLGDCCWFTARVSWENSAATGEMRFTLPFTSSSGPFNNFAVALIDFNISWPSGQIAPVAVISADQAFFTIRSRASSANATIIPVDNAGFIIASGWYITA